RPVIQNLRRAIEPVAGQLRVLIGGRSIRVITRSGPDTDPPSTSNLEVRNENSEKSSPRLRRRTCRGFGSAGCRSSGQGEAGPVREDLRSLWLRLLLHSRFRDLPEGRWLCPGRLRLECLEQCLCTDLYRRPCGGGSSDDPICDAGTRRSQPG